MAEGPLAGFRILDLTQVVSGPFCTQTLGDLGADIIKVEPPEGDTTRRIGQPRKNHVSSSFLAFNRNKRSITLDTRGAEDLNLLDELVGQADVFIQNFRPGIAEKLNVGVERLQAINPKLIYCSISGFGSEGPDKERPAYDTVAQAASGWLRLLINPENPRVVGPAIADSITGFYAAFGILGALHEREKTGRGRRIDVSMLEAMCHFNLDDVTHYFSANEVMGPYSRPRVSQS